MKCRFLCSFGILTLSVIALAAQTQRVTGVVTKVEEDWDIEQPCGMLANLFHRCSDVLAYRATLRDSTRHETYLVFYRYASGGPHPQVGDSGVWVLHRDYVMPLTTCAQRTGFTGTGCLGFNEWVLESDDDMPVGLR